MQVSFSLLFLGSFSTFVTRLIFVFNGNIKEDNDNILGLHMFFVHSFVYFRILKLTALPAIIFQLQSKTQSEMVLKPELDQNIEDLSKKNKTTKEMDQNPPSYSQLSIISEN